MANVKYVIGIDYGTDSVRSVLVDAGNGLEVAESVFYYPRWKEGKYCIPAKNQFRQHPLDYTEGLIKTIKDILKKAGPEAAGGHSDHRCLRCLMIEFSHFFSAK